MHMCERQAGTQSMHIQYSYNSNVSMLLVSLLSRASGSLRTTPFNFFRNVFTLVLIIYETETSQPQDAYHNKPGSYSHKGALLLPQTRH